MATEAGIISALIGTATATAVDGTVRNLQVGDKVYPNEIITTGIAGAIEIEFPDGGVMDLGRNSQAVLDIEAFEFDVAETNTPPPAADLEDDIDAIQQALLAGDDPTEVAEPTAAGPGAQPTSEGGSEAVVVDYLAPRVTPQAGFETIGPSIIFPTIEEEQLPTLIDANSEDGDTPIIPPPPESISILSTDQLNFAEANLSSGTNPDSSSLTKTGTFTVSASSGVDLLSIDGEPVIQDGNILNNLPTLTNEYGNTLNITNATLNLDGTYTISYSYTLNNAVEHSQPDNDTDLSNSFEIIATDSNGISDSANLDVSIQDDNPLVTATQPEMGFEMQITNLGSISAGYDNSYGYYIKNENGEPTSGVVLFANVKQNVSSTVQVEGVNPEDIGFFVISNGGRLNSELENGTEVTFEQLPNGSWQAVTTDGVALLSNFDKAPALFDNSELNLSNYDYLNSNANPGNQNWEDVIGGGDQDNNDVNINVEFTKTKGLTVNENLLADGDDSTAAVASLNISEYFATQYGADGAGTSEYALSIDTNVATGLNDTETGQMVSLRYQNDDPESGVVEGYIENGDDTSVVFTLSIDQGGLVTLEQLRPVFHDDPTDSLQLLTPATINPGAIDAVLTVTDSDGDTADASIDLGVVIAFNDDGPSATDYVGQDTASGESTSGQFNFNVGADGGGLSAINNTILIFGADGWSQSVATEFGTIRVTEQGDYEYQSTSDVKQTITESIELTMTDGDGDTATFEAEYSILPSVAVTPISLQLSIGSETLIESSTNFITNGSFENINGISANGNSVTDVADGSLAGGQLVSMQSITGWQLVDESMPAMEPHAGGHGQVGTTDGNHYMDLGASPGNSGIYQQVSGLVNGLEYTLSFDYLDKALKMANNADSGVMQVIWNGEVLATIDGDNRDSWESVNFTVIGGSFDGSNTLVFNEIGSIDNHGIAIDNVALTPNIENDYYQYDLSILASAAFDTDGNSGVVKIDATELRSQGIDILGYDPVINFPNRTFEIEVENDQPLTLTLVSDNPLTPEVINSIEGSLTFVSDNGAVVDVTSTAYAELVGTSADNQLIGTDSDELIIGGAGDDILTGGDGKDIFVWNAGDEGVAGVPASDTVKDFNISQGDVLDFSDILVGEDAGNLTDFISITEDGSDIVIELKPEAGDVTQKVTLQGTSLADLGVGGFDASTQQAEIINKLVQDGHVNVDS